MRTIGCFFPKSLFLLFAHSAFIAQIAPKVLTNCDFFCIIMKTPNYERDYL